MNRIILGSILVTMMGGVPGVTYLLTQKEEASVTTKNKEPSELPNDQNNLIPPKVTAEEVSDGQPSKGSCTSTEGKNTCSGPEEKALE